jgi:hypothetical protein
MLLVAELAVNEPAQADQANRRFILKVKQMSSDLSKGTEGAHAVEARARARRPMRAACSVTAAMVVVCVAAQPSYAAGRVFSDGFESGNTSQWSSDGSRDRCIVVGTAHDGGGPHSGSNMLECNWNGLLDWSNASWYSTLKLSQSAWNYSREFLIRFWVRFDADVNHVNGDKVFRLYPNDKLDSFFLAAQMEASGGPIYVSWEHINGEDGPVSWGLKTKFGGDQSWHKVEIYVKHNASGASDGVVRVWLDGSIVQESTNIVSAAPGRQWGPMYLMSNWTNNPGWQHGPNNHVYWDDIEIYTDQGSGGTGLMADATMSSGASSGNAALPSPPQGVAVR